MSEISEKRFMPPAATGIVLRVAAVLGMDDDTRAALKRIEELARVRKTGVAGRFMPDRGVAARLAELGVVEEVEAADFFRFRSVAIPYGGVPARNRREWEESGQLPEDFTSPQVRRAQVALGLLKMEGAQPLVIGRHDDPETLAISGGSAAVAVLEDTTDTSRLVFAPAFGAVCQTTLSPRRVKWLAQQLRLRWRDARVTFLDTVAPAMLAREDALERLLIDSDRVIVVGDAGESSCEALAETASRRSRPAHIVAGPDELFAIDFLPREKVALTAGAFATDTAIRAVAAALVGK
ncbi:MAG: hypothetical protein V4640_03475 [Verrucomicrobiota bacterium]